MSVQSRVTLAREWCGQRMTTTIPSRTHVASRSARTFLSICSSFVKDLSGGGGRRMERREHQSEGQTREVRRVRAGITTKTNRNVDEPVTTHIII